MREDLRTSTPYGAPQLDVPVRLNTDENSYDVPQEVAIAVVESVARQVQHLNRYPDREFTALREALAGYLTDHTGQPVDADQVWAANGSNRCCSSSSKRSAAPGDGRWASRRPTRCTHGSRRSPGRSGWTGNGPTRLVVTST